MRQSEPHEKQDSRKNPKKEVNDMEEKRVVVVIEGVVAKEVSSTEAMSWVFDERNTEEHPLHIYDMNGNEIEW